MLDGPRHSVELDRAREIRPLIETVDVLLDLHSMLWPSEPLILSGASAKGRRWRWASACRRWWWRTRAMSSGRRLIDYARFTDAGNAVRRQPGGGRPALGAGDGGYDARQRRRAAAALGVMARRSGAAAARRPARARFAEVTMAVTAATSSFAFVQPYRGGDVMPRRNTLIALDGDDGDPHAA